MIDDLFPGSKPPRAAPRVLMHFHDVGLREDGEQIALFACTRCGHESNWIPATDTEVRRGIPCPICNASTSPVSAGIDRTTGGRIGQP